MTRLGTLLLLGVWLCLWPSTGRAQQYPLVGGWQGEFQFNGLPVTADASLLADGSFHLVAQGQPLLDFTLDGSYTAPPGQGVIKTFNRRWRPAEQCLPGMDLQYHCVTIPVPRETVLHYRFTSPTTLLLTSPIDGQEVECRKVR
jgi:hypothetical protein